MKITIVQGAFLPVPPRRGGAVEKIWFALGKEFARCGHEVTHISRAFEELPREENSDGVRYLRVPGFDAPKSLVVLKFLDLLYSLRVRRMLPVADILVTNTFWLPMLVRSASVGNLYVHVARYPKGQMRFYSHASRIQTVSNRIKEAILAQVPSLAAKVHCIGNPLPARSEAIPVPQGSSNREKQVLFVGRIHPEKGIELLIDGFARLPASRFGNWKLVIIGPAEAKSGGGGEAYLAGLKRRSAALGDRIVWTGPVFDAACLQEHYRKAALFVYPSLADLGEASPLAPLEAMDCGCPALVSDLGCFRDYLSDGATGFVFDHRGPNAVDALATKLGQLLENPDELRRVGEAGQGKARQFSLESVAAQYMADFHSILDNHRG
ncbi:MAG: glycosyltransferase family 4 protein [Verrucomicrobiota bacterium]